MAAAVSYIEIPEPESCWQMEAGRSAGTLVKYPDLRIVLVTMKPKTRIRRHRTKGRLAFVALSGHIRIHLPNATVGLPAEELLAVDRNLPHDVEAIRQSTFLLVISWPGAAPEKDGNNKVADENNAHDLREKMLDKTIADSFPASDPPSTDPAPLADLFAA